MEGRRSSKPHSGIIMGGCAGRSVRQLRVRVVCLCVQQLTRTRMVRVRHAQRTGSCGVEQDDG